MFSNEFYSNSYIIKQYFSFIKFECLNTENFHLPWPECNIRVYMCVCVHACVCVCVCLSLRGPSDVVHFWFNNFDIDTFVFKSVK